MVCIMHKRFKITSVEKIMEIFFGFILKRLLFIIAFRYYRIESSRLKVLMYGGIVLLLA